jgi:hypothetical protein
MGQKPRAQKRIRLTRFGACIGMVFEDGGAAEMLMMPLELKRLLEAWMEHEAQKPKPHWIFSRERFASSMELLSLKSQSRSGK